MCFIGLFWLFSNGLNPSLYALRGIFTYYLKTLIIRLRRSSQLEQYNHHRQLIRRTFQVVQF